ncbi:hypothetical protein JCGZ_22949 [Jatropha curcas]|uniref:Uncharacterized protein n=1 Tax=Jatropha curcas TaxID=180498 RepID=A0A067LGD7_JATCU|nr:hypothetical protein JCGZ_22949 [Jatropha curcas]
MASSEICWLIIASMNDWSTANNLSSNAATIYGSSITDRREFCMVNPNMLLTNGPMAAQASSSNAMSSSPEAQMYTCQAASTSTRPPFHGAFVSCLTYVKIQGYF